jgi:cell division protein FtsQ
MSTKFSTGFTFLGKRSSKPSGKSKGQRKRSSLRSFKNFIFANKGMLLVSFILLFSAGAYQVGWSSKAFTIANEYVDQKASEVGMVYKNTQISGLGMTVYDEVINAINLDKGTPLYRTNILDIRGRIEFLPWVKSAFISRQLPDTLVVNVVERTPYALWQNEGEIWLIDDEGVEITQLNLGRYDGLPFVVGLGAPAQVESLMAILATEASLVKRVKTAIRVGDRRWDIEFDTGARLRLPMDGANYDTKIAWQRFAELERDHRLLGRDVVTYDMRLSDRMMVQLTDDGKDTMRNKGAPT